MSKDPSTTVEEIVGQIKMKDGTSRSFRIGTDFGWNQWGECQSNLGNSGPVIEAMVDGLKEAEVEFASDNDEDDEYEPDLSGSQDEGWFEDGPDEGDEDSFDGEVTYKIVRYYNDGTPNEVVKTGLSLADAKAHCSDPSTHGEHWFDGHTKESR